MPNATVRANAQAMPSEDLDGVIRDALDDLCKVKHLVLAVAELVEYCLDLEDREPIATVLYVAEDELKAVYDRLDGRVRHFNIGEAA